MASKNTKELNANSNTVIIGIGNEYRSDDGLGLVIADRLSKLNLSELKILKQNGEPTLLMDSWRDPYKTIVVDATSSGASPGTVTRFNAAKEPLPAQLFHYSTHSFSLADVIELARGLDKLPEQLIVYGVEGENFQNGIGLTPEVENAVEKSIELITQEIGIYDAEEI